MAHYAFDIIGFLIILGPLVIFHEFGHYIFARIFGVKAEVFSVGFGKKLWSRQMGETELRISMLPFGGYVKLMGEDRETTLSPAEQKRALHRQAPWKRFFIFFGGPLFNFVLAILIFMAILAIGEPQISNVIGRVVQDSAAAKAGFVAGDRIIGVNGKPTKLYDDVMDIVSGNPGKLVRFEVMHPSATKPVELVATPTPEPGYSLYGEAKTIGDVSGLIPSPLEPEVGISDPRSAAAKAGVKTGDSITAMNGAPVKTFEQAQTLFASAAPHSTFTLQMERPLDAAAKTGEPGGKTASYQIVLTKLRSSRSMGDAWGLRSSEMFVDKVIDASPAAHAGILAGDRILEVDGKRVYSFFDLKDAIQASGAAEGKVAIRWERAGKIVSATITPSATAERDEVLKKTTSYTVGIVPMLNMAEPDMTVLRVWNPFLLLIKGTVRMATFTWQNFVSIWKIMRGHVSFATLGGPIMMGKIAGESLARGLISFLTNMAYFSVALGVLNVLPIPVLDGGHLLLLSIETVRGKPMTLRTMEIIQSIGLTAILLLMFIVMRNDIIRLIP